jgi:hypothetical protein
MLAVDLSGPHLIVKAVGEDRFKFRKLVESIPTAAPIYGLNEDGDDVLLHHVLNKTSLRDLLLKVKVKDILFSQKAQAFYEQFEVRMTNIAELPEIERELVCIKPPRPYQLPYIKMNEKVDRVIAALAMAAGKTYCSLQRAELLEDYKPYRLLIVCPRNVRPKWQTEIRKFLERDSHIYESVPKTRQKKIAETKNHQIVITHYQRLGDLVNEEYDQIILDEAHLCKNETSHNFKNAYKLVHTTNPEAGLQLLTGTPVYSSIADLYSLLKLASPETAGSRQAFLSRYRQAARYIKQKKVLRNGRVIEFKLPVAFKAKNMSELHERIKSVVFRINNDEFRNFEDCTEFTPVEMTPKQKQLYRMVKDEFLARYDSGEITPGTALTEMLRLLQMGEGAFNLFPDIEESGKLDYVKEKIDGLYPEEKLVHWSAFNPITHKIAELYPDKAVMFNGDVSDSRKKLAIWAFQGIETDEDAREYERLLKFNKDWKFGPGEAQVFSGVINWISAIGFDLHSKCNYQVATMWNWTQSTNEQALARVKRNGEFEKVFTEYVYSLGTREAEFLEKILSKYKANTEIVEGQNSMTSYEIREMIDLLRVE